MGFMWVTLNQFIIVSGGFWLTTNHLHLDLCTPPLKVHESEDLLLQDVSLLEIEFFSKTEIIAWLLMTIAKDRSTHSESLILQVCFFWSIYLMNDSSCHNVDKDGDQNIDLPYDQLDCNVGISHSDAELEQVKLKLLEGIQHFEVDWFGII
jgi:hypothetical protein